jgi:peptide deformylase
MHGEPITVDGSEFLARALQHETDHLDGILFIERMPKDFRKLAMKEIRDSEWFMSAVESGSSPIIKVSPHQTFGKGN